VLNPAPAPRGPIGVATGLAALLLVSYGYFMPAPASNELSRFALVRSLVERGRIDIDPFAETTPDVARQGEHAFSDKAPGAAFLAAPAYAAWAGVRRLWHAPAPAFRRESQLRGTPVLGEDRLFLSPAFRRAVYVCNLGTNVVAGALLGALFFGLLVRWGLPPTAAVMAMVALNLGSLIFAYSTMFFGHVLAATALFGAFVALDHRTRAPDRRDRWTLLAGLLAGVAVLVELPVALGALILAVYLATDPADLGTRDRLRTLALFAVGATPPLLALAVYQTAAFGAPWSSGYAHVANPTFAAGMAQGILGVGWPRPQVVLALLVGRARGLLYVAPVLALAIVGLVRGVRDRQTRRRAVTASAIVVAFLLMNAGYYMWWGGAALGPRHVVPALPFLCLGFAWFLPAQRWQGDLFVVLLGISVINQLAAVVVSPLAPPGGDVLFGHVYRHLVHGDVAILPGASNVGLLLGLPGPFSLLPLLALWGLGFWAVVKTLGRRAEIGSG
jgi:hypothetical protein